MIGFREFSSRGSANAAPLPIFFVLIFSLLTNGPQCRFQVTEMVGLGHFITQLGNADSPHVTIVREAESPVAKWPTICLVNFVDHGPPSGPPSPGLQWQAQAGARPRGASVTVTGTAAARVPSLIMIMILRLTVTAVVTE